MAKYTHLDIYKTTYEFLLYLGGAITHFSREFRYTLGEKLIDDVMNIITLIYRANGAQDMQIRAQVIRVILERMVAIEVKVRLASGLKCIPIKKYEIICQHLARIDQQLNGWYNYTLSKKTKESENNG